MIQSKAEPTSYAQWGDDVLVLEFFNQKKNGVFLEAGANEPKFLSQTYLLERHGWTGILVEPVVSCCEALRRERPNSHVFQNALGAPDQHGKLRLCVPDGVTQLTYSVDENAAISKNDTIIEADFITITACLKQAGYTHLDYLSLDLEGSELNALRGLDFTFVRPRLIIVEDHLGELSRHFYLRGKGYRLVKRNGANSWYVPNEVDFPRSFTTRFKINRKLTSVFIRGYIRRAKFSVKVALGLKSMPRKN
jgi:FkbM family methyltransferase